MKNQKLKSPSSAERKFGVLLEGMDKKIDQVLEGHSVLDHKIENLNHEFQDFRHETNSNFKSVFDYLSRIDDEIKDIKLEISDLKNKLSSKTELSRLANLEKRVKELEVKLASHRN
jgi:chromosome segregation ATPase